MLNRFNLIFMYGILAISLSYGDDKDAALLKNLSNAGKISSSEKTLYEQSIQATKQSLARETIDMFYRDARDFYEQRRFDEALPILDKIISIDSNYQDAISLRDTIMRVKSNKELESTKKVADDFMKQGKEAVAKGETVQAIEFYKKALTVNPNNGTAKKKIAEINASIARKEFEQGYLHYHANNMQDALDSWSNAVALDPSYKKKGLLLLMSKVELDLRKDRIAKLLAQGSEQFQAGNLDAALTQYDELLKLDPRNEEARRYSGKIKIQMGQQTFKEARDYMSRGMQLQAIKAWERCIVLGYEVQRSQEGIKQAEASIQRSKERVVVAKRRAKQKAKQAEEDAESAEQESDTSAPQTPMMTSNVPSRAQTPAAQVDPAQAMDNYRKGMGALRQKNYKLAVELFDTASRFDPTNERIYVARERAKQEWAATQGSAQ